MCGICVVVNLQTNTHDFQFNPLHSHYSHPNYPHSYQQLPHFNLQEYAIKQALLVESIDDTKITELLRQRGPDGVNKLEIELNGNHFKIFHSLLHLRGNQPIYQPLDNETCCLVYNGELYEHSG